MAIMARKNEPQQPGTEQGNNPPRCCFSVESVELLHQGEVFQLGKHCQFADEFSDKNFLIEIAGHWFCPYHLPFNEAAFAELTRISVKLSEQDKAKLKTAWSTDRQETFINEILDNKVRPAHEAKSICDLTGVVFPSQFSSKEVTFPAVSFAHAKFYGDSISFNKSWFADLTTFECAKFIGTDVWFNNVNFRGGNVWFNCAEFSAVHTHFEGVQFFGGAAIFKDTLFTTGIVSFSNSSFCGGSAVFSGAQFAGGPVSFEGVEFSGGDVRFVNARFCRDVSFAAPQHDLHRSHAKVHGDFDLRNVDFEHAEFRERVTFENRRFTQYTNFADAHFGEAPQFHGCALHQDTTFPPMDNFVGREGEEAARAYRTLKLAMGQHRATTEEAMFWALEQIAARSTLDPLHKVRDFVPWLLSWAYEIASFYGLSVSRPLVLFLISTLIVFPVYVYQPMHEFAASGRVSDGITLREISDAETFSMRQVTRPFAIWSRFDLDALQLIYPSAKAQLEAQKAGKSSPKPEPTYFWTKMTATAQSILSLALVALFLLAIRRRFRMV